MAITSGKQVTEYELSHLLLDRNNPRFGMQDRGTSQPGLLDLIVEKFGVDDVLSSLAVNGYFAAEPMVCRAQESDNKAVVVEGNRRLAACLILTGEDRAKSQAARTNIYQPIWEKHGRKQIDPVPVIVFEPHEKEQEILSYLGVRHIASAKQWDSYAKAAWVAQVVQTSGMDVADVSTMIGDQHRTVSRLLEGYYFIQQLISEGAFRPKDSVRRGRGSVTDYPFSWVYTILGYSTVRTFLELDEDSAKPDPMKKENLKKGGLITRAMFGDAAKGQSAAVDDSRQLGMLAAVVASQEKIALLEQGKTLGEIEIQTQPLVERVRHGLIEVRDIQADLLTRVSEDILPSEPAIEFTELAGRNRRVAGQLEKKIKEAADGDEEN